jgi:hypothetical protein
MIRADDGGSKYFWNVAAATIHPDDEDSKFL